MAWINNRKLSNEVTRFIEAGVENSLITVALYDVSARTQAIRDVLTGSTISIIRKERKIETELKTSFQFSQAKPFYEVLFQCDKTKYAYVMGAKHHIKEHLKDSRKCSARFNIKNTEFDQSMYSSYYISRVSAGHPVLKIKKLAEKCRAVLEFSKKGSWRAQNEVVVHAAS